MTFPDGVHQMPREHYDQLDDRINWSKLKILGKSPAHYRHSLLAEQETSDALQVGIATHLAAYEPERFATEVVRWDGDRRGPEWKVFEAANRNRIILKAEPYDLSKALANAARTDKYAAKWFVSGKAEQTVLWTHEANGRKLSCKARLDFISEAGAIVDLKTTRDASPEKFGKQAFELGYHGQAAIYSDAYFTATGKRLPYIIVAVEKTPPHVVQIYHLDEETIGLGATLYQRLLAQYAVCKEESHWPGYADGPIDLRLPRWAWPFDEDDAEGMGITFGGSNGA